MRTASRITLASAAAALVVSASRRRARTGSEAGDDRLPIAAVTRSGRNVAVARLAGRRALDRGLTAARGRLADDATRRRLRADLERREAQDVVAALGSMKGALMKLGQMASYLDEGMPPAMRESLATLRQDAPSMPGDLALTEIERGLGRPLHSVFAEIEPEPLAAASIGQVHRGLTTDGRPVAVKVQYPGIAAAIAADLANTDFLGSVLGMAFPGLDPAELVAELRARIGEELDYVNEASNQRLFADFFRGHPHIWVPEVDLERSSATVLTTEYVPGRRFEDAYDFDAEQQRHYAEVVYRFVFRSLNRLHAFNGDPHPGNYLLADDGRVAFIDFGLVKRFERAEIDQFGSLIRSMLRGDRVAFRAMAERSQLLQPGAPFDDDQIYEWFTTYYELVLHDRTVAITPEYAASLLRQTFDASANEVLKFANVPPAFALVQRINLGLFSMLANLGAEANWRRISEELWEWIDAPPSTAIGQDEATWWQSRAG